MSVVANAIKLPGFYTIPEAAALLGISRQATHKRVNLGRPPEKGGLGDVIYKVVNTSRAEQGAFTRPVYLIPADVVDRAVALAKESEQAQNAALLAVS